jgi:hypothetical protein
MRFVVATLCHGVSREPQDLAVRCVEPQRETRDVRFFGPERASQTCVLDLNRANLLHKSREPLIVIAKSVAGMRICW